MRRSSVLRRGLVSAALVVCGAMAWLWLAPPGVAGSTSYLTTDGDSMAPRFHNGDVALIRPADRYRVGEIVAYRSEVLDTVVLHRIIGRDGDRFVFKGDNNDFVDPTRPDRAELVGKLWLRVPKGGLVLSPLRSPIIVAVLIAGAALFSLFGGGRRRRRRDRRRRDAHPSARQGDRPMTSPRRGPVRSINERAVLTVSVVALVAFLGLGTLAFTRPASQAATVKTPYAENVSFGYRADAPAGPVYAGGVIRTGDPIFLRLVDRVRVKVGYRFAAAAPHRVAGTQEVILRLTSPTGWSRSIRLAPRRRFTGDRAGTTVTLDLGYLRSLIRRVERLTGAPQGGAYTLAIAPRMHLTGTLAGQPLNSDFRPALSFQLDALQLRPGSGSTASDDQQDGFTPGRRGTVAASATATNRLSVGGHGLPVAAARLIAVIGLLLAAASALLAGRRGRSRPCDPTARIRARYGHLIVPIAGIAHNPARPPIDVTSIDALAQLAERSERLILHHQPDGTDTYLVDDEGTLYRYQAGPAGHHHPAAPSALHDASVTAPANGR